MNFSAIDIKNLSVAYDEGAVFSALDVTVPTGLIAGIIGPNGSGKSTLINAVLGLIKPKDGTVKILGQSLQDVREKIAYVPQKDGIDLDFPVTVLDVVLMGRIKPGNIFRRITRSDREAALHALEKVGMKEYRNRQIGKLSGGQRQRVFLARALARGAEIYFLDEPFAGVDAVSESRIMDVIRELKQEGKSILMVHHDLQSVTAYFDYVLILNRGLVAAGPTETTFRRENLEAAYGGAFPFLHTPTD